MIKILINFLKKIVGVFAILYLSGYLLSFLNVFIPINFYTIIIVYFLGFPGLTSLIFLFFIVK